MKTLKLGLSILILGTLLACTANQAPTPDSNSAASNLPEAASPPRPEVQRHGRFAKISDADFVNIGIDLKKVNSQLDPQLSREARLVLLALQIKKMLEQEISQLGQEVDTAYTLDETLDFEKLIDQILGDK